MADGVLQVFSFTAPETDFYDFSSVCTESNMPGWITLYDSDFDCLISGSRYLSKMMAAGETIYVCVSYDEEVASNSFTLVSHKVLVETLNHDASAAVTLGAGESKLFTFTAPEAGEYVFYSTGNYDTYGYLYDANFKQIASDDDGGNGNNFKITYTLTAGQKVYLKARFYRSTTSGTFCVMEGNALAVPVVTASTTSASVNENVTLSWNAVDGATHYYVWSDNYVLADITDTQYTYTCHVIGSDTV